MNQPYSTILAIDFETRWSSKPCDWSPDEAYTLSKLTTEEYIRDKRFKAFGACIHEVGSDRKTQWYSYDELPRILATYDWDKTAVLAHNCVTGDHEVRTRDGWVRFDALQDGVDVLQWDSATGTFTYTPAVVVRKQYVGDMYEWDTQYHKGCYTPNHRHYYQTPTDTGWRVAETTALATMGQNNVYLPTAGILRGTERLRLTPLQARVLEMIRADGNVTDAYDARFKFKKARKIARCRALLDGMSVSYGVRTTDGVTAIHTHADERVRCLTHLLGAGKNKQLGSWVLDMPLDARLALLDECQFWDGTVAAVDGHGQTMLYTNKKTDAHWLAETAILSGRSANVVNDIPNTRGFSRPDSVLHKVNIRRRSRAKLSRAPRKFPYAGTVYCLTTPTSAFLVRRGGTTWVTGNSMFDVGILSFIYDVKPCFIFDSLSMGRALRGVEAGNSLAKLAAAYGLPPKGQAVHSTDGLEEISPEIENELAAYCAHDVYLCEQIFSRLLLGVTPEGEVGKPYPKSELRLISMTLKMFTEPELILDVPMLEKAKAEDEEKLRAALVKAGVEESDLASNEKFAELLEQLGVPRPMKTSKTTGKPALALAKTDALFQAMLNGDNEDVALLCEARLKVKSTGERTRAQRFLGIASRGALPVPLNYYGAGTGRYAATGKINLQNLKRGSFLRNSIMAPPGCEIIAGDLSQIEPRVLAWLADYDDLLDIFRAGGDPYAVFGSQMFSIPGLTKETHPLLRQSAKSGLLGAGYGLGWSSFAGQLLVGFLGAPPQRYTMVDAKMLGVTKSDVQDFLDYEDNVKRMEEIPHTCSEQELLIHCLAAKAIIDKYRTAAAPIVKFWELLGHLITHSLVAGNVYEHKCLTFKKEEIVLANGMSLLYPDIRIEQTKKGPQFHYAAGDKRVKLYPGKVCNNVTQGTARIVMTDAMLRVDKRFPVKGTVHDELLALAWAREVEEGKVWVKQEMIRTPKWMPGIPLNADVGAHRRYGQAKG